MYCTSCGKKMPGIRSRCPECRKLTPAFWFNIYSLAIWLLISQTVAEYSLKLAPHQLAPVH